MIVPGGGRLGGIGHYHPGGIFHRAALQKIMTGGTVRLDQPNHLRAQLRFAAAGGIQRGPALLLGKFSQAIE